MPPSSPYAPLPARPPTLPAWVPRLLALRLHSRRPGLAAAYLLTAVLFVVDSSADPALIVSALYLLPLLVVALLSQSRWHGYAFALGLTALVYVADRADPISGRASGLSTVWNVAVFAVTFLLVVAVAHVLVRLTLTLQEYVVLLEAARAEAWTLAVTDPLTGLANRRSFDARLEEELRRCSRQGRPLALLMLDIDHFKEINDGWGHAAGDAALRQVAAGLRTILRAGDLAARLGGDEFAVVLPEADAAQAQIVAHKLREYIAAMPRGDIVAAPRGTRILTRYRSAWAWPACTASTCPSLIRA